MVRGGFAFLFAGAWLAFIGAVSIRAAPEAAASKPATLEDLRKNPKACLERLTGDDVRRSLPYVTAGRKDLPAAPARILALAVEESACRAVLDNRPGACGTLESLEGKPGSSEADPGRPRVTLVSRCLARAARVRFFRAVFIERKEENESCAAYFSAQEWNPYKAEALDSVCSHAVKAYREADRGECAALADPKTLGDPSDAEELEASCPKTVKAMRAGDSRLCPKDDRKRPTAECAELLPFASAASGRAPCQGWDCVPLVSPESCVRAERDIVEEFCRSLSGFHGERFAEALLGSPQQR